MIGLFCSREFQHGRKNPYLENTKHATKRAPTASFVSARVQQFSEYTLQESPDIQPSFCHFEQTVH